MSLRSAFLQLVQLDGEPADISAGVAFLESSQDRLKVEDVLHCFEGVTLSQAWLLDHNKCPVFIGASGPSSVPFSATSPNKLKGRSGAPAGDETLAAVDRLGADIKGLCADIQGMFQGFLSTIQPLLRKHIAASNCSSGGNNNPNPSAGAGGNTSDHGDPAGNGGDGGSHSVPGSSHGGASLIHSGAAGGSHGASAGATGLVVSNRGLNAEYLDSLVGLEEEDLNTAAQNMLMQLFSDPQTMSSFGVAAPPTLEAISVVVVEEFLRKAGQAVARKVIQQRGMVIRDMSATVDQA